MTTHDKANHNFLADIQNQFGNLDEQRALRETVINCLFIWVNALAEAALEPAFELCSYPDDGYGTTNDQALRLIKQGDIETATELLKAAVERPRVAH